MLERLSRLDEYVHLLEGLRGRDLSDPYNRGALERYLQLSAEAALDVGEMLIAREGLRKPGTYRDVIRTLGEAGILPGSSLANSRASRACGTSSSTITRGWTWAAWLGFSAVWMSSGLFARHVAEHLAKRTEGP